MTGVEIFGYYLPPIVITRILGLFQTILGIIILFLLGRILHESTHWFVAWLVGADVKEVKVSLLSGGYVGYELPADSRWRFWAIQASPQLLGLLIGIPYLAWLIVEGTSPLLWYFIGTFLVAYSVLGSAGDLIPIAARGDGHLWHPSERDQLYLIALGMALGGAILGSMDPNASVIKHWGAWTGRWLIAGGFAIVVWDLLRREHTGEA